MNPIKRWAEALEDVLALTVNATTYPDGPNIPRDEREALRAVLAEMRAVTVVEGAISKDESEPKRGYSISVWPFEDGDLNPLKRPALLILLPETDHE